MIYPTKKDLANAPLWDNYIFCQTIAAMSGLIPLAADTIYVRIEEFEVHVDFFLLKRTDEDLEDIVDIYDDLQILVGDGVVVHYACWDQSELKTWEFTRNTRCAFVRNMRRS